MPSFEIPSRASRYTPWSQSLNLVSLVSGEIILVPNFLSILSTSAHICLVPPSVARQSTYGTAIEREGNPTYRSLLFVYSTEAQSHTCIDTRNLGRNPKRHVAFFLE